MLTIAGEKFSSRLLVGTALYPSLEIMDSSVKQSGCDIVTVALKRQMSAKNEHNFHRIGRPSNPRINN